MQFQKLSTSVSISTTDQMKVEKVKKNEQKARKQSVKRYNKCTCDHISNYDIYNFAFLKCTIH